MSQHDTALLRDPHSSSSVDYTAAAHVAAVVGRSLKSQHQSQKQRQQGAHQYQPHASPRLYHSTKLASTHVHSLPELASSTTMVSSNPNASHVSAIQRTTSMDSTLSSLSSSAVPQRSQSSSSLDITDVPGLITAAGSPEAAILKLLHEKQSASAHTSQLWRLVEKQRAMIIGLNKDLERTLKEKEKYRKKLREHLEHSLHTQPASASAIPSASHNRDDSQSPRLPASAGLHITMPSSPPLPTSTSLDGLSLPSSRPGATSSASLPNVSTRDTGPLSTRSPRTPSSIDSPKTPMASAATAVSDGPTMTSPQSFSSPKERLLQTSRKVPPAPLDLSQAPTVLREPSDSDEEDSGETPPVARGRQKTREDDDRHRGALVAHLENDHTNRSISAPPLDRRSSAEDAAVLSDAETVEPGSPHIAQIHSYQSMGAIASSHAQSSSDPPSTIKRHPVTLTILSPGLPMSPRPGDRPMNSPIPRPPKQSLINIPTSPGIGGMPLSPRAPRQPIPLPPQTPLSFASPHLARAETYQAMASNSMTDRLAVPPKHSPEAELSSSYSAAPRSPGEIYRGLVSEQYPGLLLPPNALPSIFIKVDSSRLRPSRNSFMAPKQSEENPVITLAVFARSDKTQSWRVEKTLGALSVFDQQIKAASCFRTKLPDRSLFTGHAPARIDARRSALGLYFDSMLDTPMDDQAALIICGFLTADSINAEMPDYFPGPHEPTKSVSIPVPQGQIQGGGTRKDGYLTKRGKNFGGWKARYFVLDGPNLKYFEAPGGAQLGSIKLPNAQIGKQTQQPSPSSDDDVDNQYRHAFLILEPKRKDSSSHVRHVLCAESDEERDSWVEALLQYVGHDSSPSSSLRSQDTFHASRSPRPQKSMSDLPRPGSHGLDTTTTALRSVPYQATVAADAPVMGPKRDQATPSPIGSPIFGDHDSQQSQSHPLISGPKNGVVIQDAGMWGNKKEPVTQTKDKKRSIFGFRGRASSDTVSGPNPKDLQQNEPPTYARPVFGAPLAEAAEFSPPSDVPVHLPAVVYRCIEYLRAKDARSEEGIFRLSGSNIVIKALRERFNVEGDVKLLEDQYYDIHAVASLLKLYLRELPATILTREYHLEFLKGLDLDESAKPEFFNILVNKLPRANRELLEILASFLREIVDNEKVNKMGVRNVGIVFAPTLNIPAPLISLFVLENDKVFGPPIDISSPVVNQGADTPVSGVTPESLRSPRKRTFSDAPTPSYNQTAFDQLTSREGYDTQLSSAQHIQRRDTRNENGNENLQSRGGRNAYSNGVQLSTPMSKQARRESNTLFMNIGPMAQREPALSRLRENESIE